MLKKLKVSSKIETREPMPLHSKKKIVLFLATLLILLLVFLLYQDFSKDWNKNKNPKSADITKAPELVRINISGELELPPAAKDISFDHPFLFIHLVMDAEDKRKEMPVKIESEINFPRIKYSATITFPEVSDNDYERYSLKFRYCDTGPAEEKCIKNKPTIVVRTSISNELKGFPSSIKLGKRYLDRIYYHGFDEKQCTESSHTIKGQIIPTASFRKKYFENQRFALIVRSDDSPPYAKLTSDSEKSALAVTEFYASQKSFVVNITAPKILYYRLSLVPCDKNFALESCAARVNEYSTVMKGNNKFSHPLAIVLSPENNDVPSCKDSELRFYANFIDEKNLFSGHRRASESDPSVPIAIIEKSGWLEPK